MKGKRRTSRPARRKRSGSSHWLLACGGLASLVVVGWMAWRGTATPTVAFAAGPPDAGAPAAPRETVKIVFQTVPPMKAEVRWGKKRLGLIKGPRKPFILERPRDSGPLDVVIKAEGQIPVHTRAYTFTDAKVFVRLTPVAEKHKLFGYRQEVDAGADAGPVPPPPGVPAFGPPGPPPPDGGVLAPVGPPLR